jgi:hypothetical protein
MASGLAGPYDSLRGVQQARIESYPPYASTSGDETIALARLAGIELDEWQQTELRHEMGESSDWKCPKCTHRAAEPIPCPQHPGGSLLHPWAAFECCEIVSRQNGKSEKRVVRMLGGLYIVEEQLQIYSAHLFDTAMEIFRRLTFIVENCDELRAEVKQRGGKLVGITRSHGQEGIELRDGRRIRFKARTGGGGRGFSADCLYLDEAMILPEVFLGATVPTLSARPNPQICLSGSAPDEEDPAHDGVVLAKRRTRALTSSDPSLAYFEHSAAVGDDPSNEDPATVPASILDDPARWAEANPGLSRIGLEYIANERRAMSDRQFAVERLSIGKYPDITGAANKVINAAAWAELADSASRIETGHMFAFDVDPGQAWATLSAAGVRGDGLYHAGVVEHQRGIGWVVDSSKGWLERYPNARLVVDPRIDLANLLKELSDASIQPVTTTASDYKDACGGFLQAVVDKRLRYMPPQPELDAAVAGATTQPLLDAWKWSRKSGALITPLVSCTLALWGVRTQGAPQVWNLNEIAAAKQAAEQEQEPERTPAPAGPVFIPLENMPRPGAGVFRP